MPLVRKRQLEEATRQETAKRHRRHKEYTEFENVGYRSDHWHSLSRSVPERIEDLKNLLAKYIGSFINGDGGILCFGVRKTGVIYGETISRKEEDNIRLLLDEIFKKMHPHVPTDGYRVSFTPVLGSAYRRYDGVKETTKLQVLEVRVASGDPFSLYEDHNHEVFLRKKDEPYGPLTPHEIKRHTVQQLRNQVKSQKDLAKLFDTPKQKRKLENNQENAVTKRKKSSSSILSPVKLSSRPTTRQSSRLTSSNKENIVTTKSTTNKSRESSPEKEKSLKTSVTKRRSSSRLRSRSSSSKDKAVTKKSAISQSRESSPEKSTKSTASRRPPSRQGSRSPSSKNSAVTKKCTVNDSSPQKSSKLSTSRRPPSRQKSRSPPSNEGTAVTKKSQIKQSKDSSSEKSSTSGRSPPRQKSCSPSKNTKPNSPSKVKTLPVPGSCKNCPFVLSSGESDHEIPLPSVPLQKKSNQSVAVSVEKKALSKLTIKPFELKKITAPLMSLTNLLDIGEQLKAMKTQQQKVESTSSLQQQKEQQTKETKKQPLVQEITRSTNKTMQVSTKPQPSKPLANKPAASTKSQPSKPPASRPTAKSTATVRPVKKTTCVASALRPPPRPPQPLSALYSHSYHQPYYSHSYNHPPPPPYFGHRHLPVHQHHELYDVQHGYAYQTHYGGYSSGAMRGPSAPSYKPHPLANSYSAPYYQ